MKSILEEFAYGNVSLQPQSFKQNPAYCEAMRFVTINEEKLLARLSEEEKAIFQKFVDAQDEANQITATENLVRGYKLGVLMTAEAFVACERLVDA